jgi:hypothetical protein
MRRFSLIKGGDTSLSLLFYLVQTFRSHGSFKATKQEDRIYALLGLSEASRTTFEVKPEYQGNLRELYVGIAHHLLGIKLSADRLDFLPHADSANRLGFLAHAGTGYAHDTPDLPSWIPDWSAKPACKPLFGTDGSQELLTSSNNKELLAEAAAIGSVVLTDKSMTATNLYNDVLARVEQANNKTKDLFFNETKGAEPYANLFDDRGVLEVRVKNQDHVKVLGVPYETPKKKKSMDSLETLTQWISLVGENLAADEAGGNTLGANLIDSLITGSVQEINVASLRSFAGVLTVGISHSGQSTTLSYLYQEALTQN